ncbi:protein jagunal homolog 1-like [Lytechinus variegatus]|uniref:protein jagunal homolog 1-like n=1 Tax=Lytechinus variegatus TaxID=7654 RepID=UPI001BB1720C|nr:protein jagunal homolog 1-like [Lytechinus variegatus]
MSSKGGPRAAGTDGSDFQHREQVASQYKISVQLKSKFRTCLFINISVVFIQLLTFAGAHFKIIPSDYHPLPWQYTWMLSGVVSLIGLNALAKNKREMLSLHNLGLAIFGFGGVFFGMTFQYSAHQRYIASGETRRIADVPLHYIWVFILALNVINYFATYFYSIRLKAAWNVRKMR